MVDAEQDGDQIRLILRPNRSLSWRGNQYIFFCISLWLGSFALAFAAMGAWMILPFVGLELLALGASLYYVSWKLSHCEVLQITADKVTVTRGTDCPKSSLSLPRGEVVVQVIAARHPWGRPAIHLVTRQQHAVQVGAFLSQNDCKGLVRELMAARLAMRHSTEGQVRIAF